MRNNTPEILKYLHLKCFENQNILENSKKCGCFYCLKIFNPAEITHWINDVGGKTALCPYCMIDSVIPESDSGDYELNTELLKDMNKYWF